MMMSFDTYVLERKFFSFFSKFFLQEQYVRYIVFFIKTLKKINKYALDLCAVFYHKINFISSNPILLLVKFLSKFLKLMT
jgi:hypothetical protein